MINNVISFSSNFNINFCIQVPKVVLSYLFHEPITPFYDTSVFTYCVYVGTCVFICLQYYCYLKKMYCNTHCFIF